MNPLVSFAISLIKRYLEKNPDQIVWVLKAIAGVIPGDFDDKLVAWITEWYLDNV